MTLEDLARELPRLQAEAKALWGEAGNNTFKRILAYEKQTDNPAIAKNWQYHLQKMVIQTDPIQYLEEHL